MANWQITSALAAILAVFGIGSAGAANQPRHVAADLIAGTSAAVPGQTLTVALRERIAPGWHTYWTNPGDSGEPTSIEWALANGTKAGPVLWPLPHLIPVGPLMEYGYDGEVLLLTEVAVPADASGSVKLAAKVSYLVCKDICVPEDTQVELTLPVSKSAVPSENAGDIVKAKAALPKPLPGGANYAANTGKGALRLSVNAEPGLFEGLTEARFFPLTWGVVSNPEAQRSKLSGGALILDLKQGDSKETPAKLEGVLVVTKAKGERTGYAVAAERGPDSPVAGGLFDHAGGAGQADPAGHAAASEGVSGSAFVAVLFAFLGGVILNLMPCVFPVLALKALGFAKAADGGHRQQGIAYLAGVLASFAALALVIAILRQGSASLGWGFQFQSPSFVLALALLFFLMGLSLSGVVSFGGGLMAIGDSLSRKPGNTGYFFTGVLAAVAATPCTAPFMGAAIGYAMTQPFVVLVAVMLALGLGFAAPVVALSLSPAMQNILPKPGAWMETLKQVLAFPLYATAAWLIWVLSIQTGSDGVMAAALSFVGVGFAAWLAGKTAACSLPVKLIAPALGVATIAVGLTFAMTAQTGNAAQGAEASMLNEEPFTQVRLEELKSQGRPVFVNLTAAWCITCKVNERVALKSGKVARAFQTAGIVYLKGDWTKANPEISVLLEHFGRAGVPLYLFYPGHGAAPRVLPQILTEGVVLDEIQTQAVFLDAGPNKGA